MALRCFPAASSLMLLLALLAQPGVSTTTYVAPSLLADLSTQSQSYLIGVCSFALFIGAGVLAVCALMNIDYSEDTLLTVDVDASLPPE